MPHGGSFDEVTIDQLRAAGGVKWSAFPEHLGAFIAEMDFGTAPVITQALHDAVDRGVFGYLPGAMADELAQACADWTAERYGWQVPAEGIRPIADVLAGLQATIEHFSTPGSPIILPTPAYMPFLTVPASMGRDIIEVPMVLEGGVYRYDLDALDAAFRAGGDLLVLCNPHNPIGRVLEPAEMRAIAEVVDRHGGRVFSDEIHAPLVYPGHRHVPYASLSDTAAAHTVTATSASKAWNLPGLKCAQVILSNEADLAVWKRVGYFIEHRAANLGVTANTVAYRSGGPWLTEVLDYLDGSRRVLGELLAERIPEIGYVAPQGTYLAWLDCRRLGLEQAAGVFFGEHAGVAVTDGLECGQAGRGFIRYNFATPRPVLEQTVDQMAAALARR